MSLYTIIYTTYGILVLSDNIRKGQVESMKTNESVKRPLETQMTSNFVIKSVFPRPNT